MSASNIEWTDETWNPVTGCRKVSPGCTHCYAETFARRGMGPWKGRRFEDVRTHPDRIDAPLRWRKPRRVFVNSMSDLFHEDVPDEFIDDVFATMLAAPRHAFQVLTKRPIRMREYMLRVGNAEPHDDVSQSVFDLRLAMDGECPWPPPNVWLGVSCEDQQRADERIPVLLRTPAAVRFLSCEPLLGPINLREMACVDDYHVDALDTPDQSLAVRWVIVGGESGPGARPCDLAWVRDIVRQCAEAGVPCFVKQLGAKPVVACSQCGRMVGGSVTGGFVDACGPTHATMIAEAQRIRSSKGGDIEEWPEDLRVREFPP